MKRRGNARRGTGTPTSRRGTSRPETRSSAGAAGDERSGFDPMFRLAFEESPCGMALLAPDTRLISLNPSACRILGYEEDELVGRTIREITHPDDIETSESLFRALVAGESPGYSIVKRYVRKDGRTVHAAGTASILRDDAGKPRFVLAQLEDVSARHEAERSLRGTEEQLRGILDASPDAIALLDCDGRVVDVNAQSATLFGYPNVEEMCAALQSAFEVLAPEDRERGLAEFSRVMGGETVRGVEFRVVRRDGSTFVAELGASPFLDETSRTVGVVLALRDVTELLQARERLEESEAKHRSVFENAAEGIVVARDGLLRMVNAAIVRLSGRTKEELLSRPFMEFVHPADRAMVLRNHRLRIEGEQAPSVYQFRLLIPDGSVRWMEIRAVLIPWEGGRATLNFLTDVTERHEVVEELEDNQERFRIAASCASDLIYEYDLRTRRLLWFGDIDGALGETRDAFPRTLEAWADRIHPEDRARVDEALRLHVEEARPFAQEYRMRRADGSWLVWNDRGTTLRDVAGQALRMIGACTDITERRRAEEETRRERDRAERYLDVAAVMLLALDAEGTITLLNRRGHEILGYETDLIGKNWFETVLPPHRVPFVRGIFAQIMRGDLESAERVEDEVLTRSGEVRIIDWRNTVLRDATGRITGTLSSGEDITERRRAQDALSLSEERYRALLEHAGAAVGYWDLEGRSVFFNRLALGCMNATRRELVGKTAEELFGRVMGRRIRARIRAAARRGRRQDYTDEVSLPTGDKYFLSTYAPVESPHGGVEGVQIISHDITARRQTEKALRESETRLRAITNSAGDAILMMDEKGRVSFWNPAAEKIFGYSKAEAIGRNLHDLLAPDRYHAAHREAFTGFQASGKGGAIGRTLTLQALRKDGAEVSVSLTLSAVRVRDSWHAVGIVRDVTEQRRAQEEVRRLKTLIDHANFGVAIANLDGDLLYLNESFAASHGYEARELLGKNLRAFHGEDQVPRVRELNDILRESGEYFLQEVLHLHRDGHVFPVLMNGVLIRDEEGKPAFMGATAIDLTDQKDIEERLRQAQKMEAIGTLAGGIAHDFNNILYSMLGFTDLAMDQAERGSRSYRCLEQIRGAGIRGADLVNRILTFSRRAEKETREIRLQTVVAEAIRLLETARPANVRVRADLDAACGRVLGDPTEVHQIVMNLGANAFHAMRGRAGVLSIVLSERAIDEETAARNPDLHPGRYASLSVEDTGHGMDEKTVGRIFEPFFTTKPVGEGTGLGLATVHGIVRGMQGTILVTSAPGNGTRFEVLLPVIGSGAEAGGEAEDASRDWTESGIPLD